jgi:acyl-CoA dehydrogenase
MERDLYDEDHDAFRDMVRDFISRYVTNAQRERWDAEGEVDRETLRRAGEAGILGLAVPEEFGGGGMLDDYRFRAVVMEDVIRAGAGSLAGALGIQDDLVVPYFVHFGTPEQQARWLPGLASGEIIGAIAMTEPGTGSNLRGITTTARAVEGGYVVNGAKTFISSGATADIVITVVNTGEGDGPQAFSLLVVERGADGFDQGKKLHKMGFAGHDTAELSYADVFVAAENLIGGEEGHGFVQLMKNLPLERLSIAVAAAAASEAGLEWTLEYTRSREAFGQPVIDFQNSRFQLAGVAATVDALWAYVDKAMLLYRDGKLSAEEAAKVKFWTTEREGEVLDVCVQLHGGYGYILEYPIARAYVDARVHRIYGGTNEIMREIVGRQLAGRR